MKKKYIWLMATFVLVLCALCACQKSGVGNTLNNVDMSARKNIFATNKNDDTGINPDGNDIDPADTTVAEERDDADTGDVDATSQGSKKGSTGGTSGKTTGGKSVTINGTADDDSNNTGKKKSKKNKTVTVGDVTIEFTDDGTDTAEDTIRELSEPTVERFVQYLPTISNKIVNITSTEHGVSVELGNAEVFDVYVVRMQDKGFNLNVQRTDNTFNAKNREGLFGRITVTEAGRLCISIFDDEKHFG